MAADEGTVRRQSPAAGLSLMAFAVPVGSEFSENSSENMIFWSDEERRPAQPWTGGLPVLHAAVNSCIMGSARGSALTAISRVNSAPSSVTRRHPVVPGWGRGRFFGAEPRPWRPLG